MMAAQGAASGANAPAARAPVIRAQDLHKTYRLGKVDVPVLRGASLSVNRGEWVAVLGASGSGKSTLLHLLGGLDRPDRKSASRVEFDGRDLSTMSGRELDRYRHTSVGFVFQFYHLLPELTVLENVLIGAMIRRGRSPGHETRQHAASLLEAFGLGQRVRHRPAELSGGERQRVAIARALVNRPALLLADEPTGNLDRATGAQILDALGLIRNHTPTLVIVTHDASVAERADRVVHLLDGRVHADRGDR